MEEGKGGMKENEKGETRKVKEKMGRGKLGKRKEKENGKGQEE